MQKQTNIAFEQVALWGGLYLEQCWLDNHLSHVISMHKRLAYWRWGLSACTTAFDYTGAILNYGCVALPIALGTVRKTLSRKESSVTFTMNAPGVEPGYFAWKAKYSTVESRIR